MNHRDHFEDTETDLPLGAHPLAFLAVLAGVVALTFLSANFLFQQVGASTFDGGLELVEVPELVGEDRDHAIERLESSGFDVSVESTQNTTAPVGQVVEQRPRPGVRIEPGSTVILAVSAGDGFARIPDVRGSPLHELQLLLFSHGFAVGEISYVESDAAVDEVVTQDPAPGESVTLGTQVHVVVSSGPPMVEIPDLEGVDALEAGGQLRDLGFGVIYEDEYSWRVDRGAVIKIEPAEEAQRGTYLVVSVSLGRAPSRPTAPPPPPPPPPSTEPTPAEPSPSTTPPTTATTQPPPSTTPDGYQTFAPYEH